MEQLVDVGIMIGTDFNPGGIPRIGPKTALKLVQEYNKLEKIEKIEDSVANIPYEEIREIFLKQETPKVDSIEFNEINYNALINFLCIEKNFSATRVNASLDKVKKSITNRNQSLERWFEVHISISIRYQFNPRFFLSIFFSAPNLSSSYVLRSTNFIPLAKIG